MGSYKEMQNVHFFEEWREVVWQGLYLEDGQSKYIFPNDPCCGRRPSFGFLDFQFICTLKQLSMFW